MATDDEDTRENRTGVVLPTVTEKLESTVEDNSVTVCDGGWARWDFLLCLAVAMTSAYIVPLTDPDLPMHLRTGAWILDNGRVPLVEPFAWTRAGAPFYAYSWAPEVLYELAWRTGGRSALSALHALLFGAVVVAAWDLARAARWSVWATRLTLAVHLLLWHNWLLAARPQLFTAIVLPMAWAGAYRLTSDSTRESSWRTLLLLLLANAVAVNSHLFFPLMLAPAVVFLSAPEVQWKNLGIFLGVTLAGWAISPYALHLGRMLALNFGRNAMQGAASPIMEMEGGFAFLLHAPLDIHLIVGGLLLLPLVPTFAERSRRARWWFGLVWLAGLGLFGIAVRGMFLWWLLALPLVAGALATVPLPSMRSTRRAVVACWIVAITILLGQSIKMRKQAPEGAPLPLESAATLEPAVRWLSCALEDRGGPKRAITIFNYGSYLTWRAPRLSWSIDGRVIFPDSVARPEVGQFLHSGPPIEPPWRSAEVVLLNARHATLPTVMRDRGWQRIPLAVKDSASATTLVVRRELAVRGARCPLG